MSAARLVLDNTPVSPAIYKVVVNPDKLAVARMSVLALSSPVSLHTSPSLPHNLPLLAALFPDRLDLSKLARKLIHTSRISQPVSASVPLSYNRV
jgi:hypothetical protein